LTEISPTPMCPYAAPRCPGIGMTIPDVQLGVCFALCVVVIGAVAFELFLNRALGAWVRIKLHRN
jgi:hypothetical protein